MTDQQDSDPRNHLEALGLPLTLLDRGQVVAQANDKVQTVLALQLEQSRRTYLLGVLISYVALAERICALLKEESIVDVFNVLPPRETDTRGRKVNTLTLEVEGEVLSLRNYYNSVEAVIRHDLNRPAYPNSAPHATQSWSQHQTEFDLICSMNAEERSALFELLWQQVLAIPEMINERGAVREVRPFEFLLLNFPTSVRGEPGGAVLQGLAYAYYRADSPSVTLRVYKVGSGSSRVGAAGDVDGWVGGSLALSVEVKDLDIDPSKLSEFDQFRKQLTRWPNATAVVLAKSFTVEAKHWLRTRELLPFDREQMASNVAYWDIPKQKMAVREFEYFLEVIQVNPKMIERFDRFRNDYL